MPKIAFSTTADIPVPKNICDQIIGQDGAVEIIKKAAIQRRHVVLVGAPGTGKSLLGQGLAELLPKTNLNDILTYPNELDDSQPIVSAVHSGEGLSIECTADTIGCESSSSLGYVKISLRFVFGKSSANPCPRSDFPVPGAPTSTTLRRCIAAFLIISTAPS